MHAQTKLCKKQSYHSERLIWYEQMEKAKGVPPWEKLRAYNCVCVPREKRWNFAKKLFVHDSVGNRNARSPTGDEEKKIGKNDL